MLEGLVEMDSVKVSSVVEWPVLWNKKEVQSFIWFVNFYWRFIKEFSHHACALFDLTQEGHQIEMRRVGTGCLQKAEGADHFHPSLHLSR